MSLRKSLPSAPQGARGRGHRCAEHLGSSVAVHNPVPLLHDSRRAGATVSSPDLPVAAIAKANDVTVPSRDVRPFLQAGVPVLDPWTGTLHREAPVRDD